MPAQLLTRTAMHTAHACGRLRQDAKLETTAIRFEALSMVFVQANATNAAEAFEQRKRERRGAAVVSQQDAWRIDEEAAVECRCAQN